VEGQVLEEARRTKNRYPFVCQYASTEAVVLQQAAVGQSKDMTGPHYATLRNGSGPKFAADSKAT